MLRFQAVDAFIEGIHVLRGVDFAVPPGSTVALVGRNGAGKTTTLRTVMGFVQPAAGAVFLGELRLDRIPPHRRPGLGIGYAPEDRRLFSAFTVEENILLPGRVAQLPPAALKRRLDWIYEVLPELQELRARPAGTVSGGQGKIAALGRALMLGRRLGLLDEPFQGLAPALAQRYAQALRRLRALDRELTLIVTESNPGLLRSFADIWLTIERGEVRTTTAGDGATVKKSLNR